MLDDELRVDLRFDLTALRRGDELRRERVGVDLEPARTRLGLRPREDVLEVLRALARLVDRDGVPTAERAARRLRAAPVHRDVRVRHELARLRARLREARAVHDVVEARLEQLDELIARRARELVGTVEGALHLLFHDAVHAARLLLLAQLQCEVGDLAPALLVHAGRRWALLEGALRHALLALQVELHAFAAALATTRTGVTSQVPSLDPAPLRWAAAVVRDRRHIGDRRDLEARRLERADRRFAPGARTADEDLDRAHALLDRLARRVLGGDLRRVRRALPRALPAGRAGGRPRDHLPGDVGERHDRVVERRLDVRLAARHDALVALAADALRLRALVALLGLAGGRRLALVGAHLGRRALRGGGLLLRH